MSVLDNYLPCRIDRTFVGCAWNCRCLHWYLFFLQSWQLSKGVQGRPVTYTIYRVTVILDSCTKSREFLLDQNKVDVSTNRTTGTTKMSKRRLLGHAIIRTSITFQRNSVYHTKSATLPLVTLRAICTNSQNSRVPTCAHLDSNPGPDSTTYPQCGCMFESERACILAWA